MSPSQQHHASEMAERLGEWLKQSARTLPDPDDGFERLLDRFPTTPQRRRWGRLAWPGRRDDASRSVALDGTPSARRRSLSMFGTLKLISAGAIVALASGYALSGALLTQPPPDPAAPASHVVAAGGSGDFATITEAVAAAAEGDTILVRPGTYSEAIVIDKTITLMGDGEREEVVIEAPADGPQAAGVHPLDPADHYALWLRGNDSTLSGFTLAGESSSIVIDGGAPTLDGLLLESTGRAYQGGADPNWNGITIRDGSRAAVRDNVIRAGGPIGIFSGSEPTIEGNTLTGGPHLWGGWNGAFGGVIRGNTIEGAFVRGIGVFGPTSVLIEGNTVSDSGEGITIGEGQSLGHDPVVRGNTITGTTQGISVSRGARPLIEGNTIGNVSNGITSHMGDPVISGNTISGGTGGGLLLTEGAPTISDNVVEGMRLGLFVMADELPALDGNTFCGNEDNVKFVSDGEEQPDPELPGNEVCPDGLVTAAGG